MDYFVIFCVVYIASHSRLHLQPIPTRATSVPSASVQPICFLALTDSSARRLMPNDFALNDFRTLFTPTKGVPYSTSFLPSSPPYILFDKPFSRNTYGSPPTKALRCNTYKKPGGSLLQATCSSLSALFSPKSFLHNPFADPHPLNLYAAILYKNSGGTPYSSSSNFFPCHTSEARGGIYPFAEFITCP